MLKSPAFKVLSRAAREVLARLEIEWINHGRKDNGRLPATFEQFVAYGIHRHAVARALRELAGLGFIEITEHGRAGNADWRRPNLFRLTYLPAEEAEPTHEWRQITDDDATMIAKGARRQKGAIPPANRKTPVPVSAKNQCRKPSPENPLSRCRKPHRRPPFPDAGNRHYLI